MITTDDEVRALAATVTDPEIPVLTIEDLGILRDGHLEADGTVTETVAFTTEADARNGEKTEPPEDVRRELDGIMQGATFYDLRHPWFETA